MPDKRDSVVASEKLGIYGIIVGLIGLATAYLAFGMGQLKIFEAYLPYIFIFVGGVYLLLSAMLIVAIRKSSGPQQYGYKSGSDNAGKMGDVFSSLGDALSHLIETISKFVKMHKTPIFVLAAFAAGAFITVFITSGSNGLNLPSLSLPTLQLFGNETQSQSSVSGTVIKTESPAAPTKISDLSVAKGNSSYTVSFSLENEDFQKVNATGNATLKFLDNSNAVLYEEKFEVAEVDFISSVYSKVVDSSLVNKTTSSTGTAVISFSPTGGVELTNATSAEVPSYSSAELETLKEDNFLKSATNVEKSLTKYAFEVTIVRMGYFTKTDSSGKENTYYRVDVKVKNIFAVEYEFKTAVSRLTIASDNYLADPESTLKTVKIKGGKTHEGYLLFKGVPSAISGGIKIRAGSTTANEEIEYNFDV